MGEQIQVPVRVLLALIVQFQQSRDLCWERVYARRDVPSETLAREDAARAGVWDLAARCLQAVVPEEDPDHALQQKATNPL